MIGEHYWATGITVCYHGEGRWGAEVQYLDDGFLDDDPDEGRISTEGTLRTRYQVDPGRESDVLAVVIDVIKADAERLGVRFGDDFARNPSIYYQGDGEDSHYPPPEGWRQMLARQAERIGWHCHYAEAAGAGQA